MVTGQGCHGAYGQGSLGVFVDFAELKLQFGSGQLLAIDVCVDFEELVLSYDHNVLVVFVGIHVREVCGLSSHSSAVEHPLVAAHSHWCLAHVLRLKCSIVYLTLEFESGRCDGGSALGRVSSLPVVTEGVKVGHVRDNRVAVSQVRGFVPPFEDPILVFRVVMASLKALLQSLAQSAFSGQLRHGFL